MEKHRWNPSNKASPCLQTTFANNDCGDRLKAPRNLLVACHLLDMPQINENEISDLDFTNPFHTTPVSRPLISSGFGSHPQQTKLSRWRIPGSTAQHQAFHSPRRKSPFAVLKTPMPCCLPSWVKTSQTYSVREIENQSVSQPSSRQHTLAHLAM